jgi:LysM repeat protein
MIKLIFLTALSWLNPSEEPDSLRSETINGKLCVIHKVDEKETLFSISRRYGTTVTSILELNPTADAGLEVGQLLKVPYVAKSKQVPPSITGIHRVQAKETLFSIARLYNISVDDIKAWNYLKDNALSVGQDLRVKRPASFSETSTTTPTTTVATTTTSSAAKGTHTVAAGETLFSISRQYGVTVDQIKTWNTIQNNELKIGQVLNVANPTVAIVTESKTQEVKQQTTQTTATTVITPVVKEEKKITPVITEPIIKISESVTGSDEVKEGGLAELIEGTEGNRKYLALHKTAKAGTIMKVRNELNNREVFVRVVGPLPNTGVNDKMVVKISKSAYDRLGAIDPKFRVEVTYYK